MSAAITLQLRHDLAATWTSRNPVLLAGEHGIETDTNRFKIGNGTTAWNSLAYAANPMTTAGDLIVGGSAGVPTRLGVGTSGQVLSSDGTTTVWSTPSVTSTATTTSYGTVKGLTTTTNTALGDTAMPSITSNIGNTAIGASALKFAANSGGSCTAVGYNALFLASTGTGNTAVGSGAGLQVTTGYLNTVIGYNAMSSNTDTGNNNVALGANAMSGGGWNASNRIIIGAGAAVNGVNGNNIVIGQGACSGQSLDGTQNVVLGNSIWGMNTGSNNIVLGYNANPSSSTVSNTITLGNSSITTLRCATTGITSLSDERDKTNIEDLPLGLDFLNELRPVKFDWNSRDESKVGIPDMGFIAQDFIAAEDAAGVADYTKLSFRDNEDSLEITQARLIPILVKAIQELSAEVTALKAAQ